jgi:uncharacterized protein YqeY
MSPQHPEETDHPEATEDIRARMRRGLDDAMKARDQQAVAALRSALARIDNAEAVDPEALDDEADDFEADDPEADAGEAEFGEAAPYRDEGHPRVAGSVLGVGAAEVDRRILTPEETAAIVRDEVTEREVAADVLARVGRSDQAERLRAQANLLTAYLDPPVPPPSGPRGS